MRFIPRISESFLRFAIIGGLATLIHATVFTLAIELGGIAPVLATLPAFLTAVLFSYFANRRWTFPVEGAHATYLPKFIAVAVAGFVMNVVITYVIVDLLGLPYPVSIAAYVAIVPAMTFTLNRRWTFGLESPR